MQIDLNADLGELPDRVSDLALLQVVTSASVACGGHAGSESSMRQVCEAAIDAGVQLGAHVSYPDRRNFGRVSMPMQPHDLAESLRRQLDTLARAATATGARVAFLKPHGALYFDAIRSRDIAATLLEVADGLPVLTMPHGQLRALSQLQQRVVFREGFADRAYQPDGTLRPRSQPGAMLAVDDAVEQSLALVEQRPIQTEAGDVTVIVDSICVHGDSPHAVATATSIAQRLRQQGVALRPFLT